MSDVSYTIYQSGHTFEYIYYNVQDGGKTIYYPIRSTVWDTGIVFNAGIVPAAVRWIMKRDGTQWQSGTSLTRSTTYNGTTYNIIGTTLTHAADCVTEGIELIAPDNTYQPDTYNLNQLLYDAFNPVTNPTMDVDIYTTGANSNKIITFRWSNITNIPEGMYPASYLVRIGANHTLAPDPSTPITTLATLPYKNKTGESWDGEYQISYQAALQAQPYESQAYIVERGQMGFKVVLYHHISEDPGYEIDAEYMFAVKEDGDIENYTDPDQGGTVDVNINISPNPNGNYNEDTNQNDPENPGQALSVDNLLTHSYALDNAKLVSFGQWLWSNDLTPTLYGNQVSPIENIISCKRIPFDVASQTTANIWLGNINTNITAPIAETTHIQHVCVDADDKYIHTFTGTYLDMRNIISIYFPYCGIFNIPASACYKRVTDTDPNLGIKIPRLTGKKVTVDYVFDMLYGTCCAILYLDGIMYGAYNGTCGVDIPLTQSNRASNELALAKMGANGVAGAISSGVSGAISGLAGGVGGAIAGSLVNAGMSLLGSGLSKQVEEDHQQIHYQTSGGFSSQLASFMPNNIRIYVEGSLYTEPDSYGHEVGYPCNINLNMSDISGYTELDSSIEIKNIPCLEEEREGLRQDLMSGFFL
jgi:hypothetical protein